MRLFRMFLLTCSGPRQAFRGPRIRVCEKPRTLALVHADRTDGPGMVEVIRIPKWERVEQPITTTIASDRVQSNTLERSIETTPKIPINGYRTAAWPR